jgi:FKBP-type peptidyl-prolyl cis-trans isomerase SlyD
MPVQEGDFIQLSYTGRIEGDVFDTTDEDTAKEAEIHNPSATYGPITIRIGSGHIVKGLEEALIGGEEGQEGDVEVPPEKAFGLHDDALVESHPVGRFKERPSPGVRVKIDDREGVVTRIFGNRAIVDFNTPLAGKTVQYHYTIGSRIEELTDRVKGLIQLYVQRDMDVTFDDGIVTVILPPGITYDRRWLLWRSRVVHEVFEYMPEVNEIVLKETFKRPETVESPESTE